MPRNGNSILTKNSDLHHRSNRQHSARAATASSRPKVVALPSNSPRRRIISRPGRCRSPQLQRPHLDFPGPAPHRTRTAPLPALVAFLDVHRRLLRYRPSCRTERRDHRNPRRRIRPGRSRPPQPQRRTRAPILIRRSLRCPRSLQKTIASRPPAGRYSQSQRPPQPHQLCQCFLRHRRRLATHFLSPPPLRLLMLCRIK